MTSDIRNKRNMSQDPLSPRRVCRNTSLWYPNIHGAKTHLASMTSEKVDRSFPKSIRLKCDFKLIFPRCDLAGRDDRSEAMGAKHSATRIHTLAKDKLNGFSPHPLVRSPCPHVAGLDTIGTSYDRHPANNQERAQRWKHFSQEATTALAAVRGDGRIEGGVRSGLQQRDLASVGGVDCVTVSRAILS